MAKIVTKEGNMYNLIVLTIEDLDSAILNHFFKKINKNIYTGCEKTPIFGISPQYNIQLLMKRIVKNLQDGFLENSPQNEIERTLIHDFMENYRKEMGYYPTVITRESVIENKEGIKLLSLNELSNYFDDFLPKLYNKVLPLNSKSRNRYIVETRFMFCYIARSMKFTLSDIGRFLNRDHTTVMHALSTFNNLYQTDEMFREKYNNIVNHIKQKQHESQSLDDSNKV